VLLRHVGWTGTVAAGSLHCQVQVLIHSCSSPLSTLLNSQASRLREGDTSFLIYHLQVQYIQELSSHRAQDLPLRLICSVGPQPRSLHTYMSDAHANTDSPASQLSDDLGMHTGVSPPRFMSAWSGRFAGLSDLVTSPTHHHLRHHQTMW
jgi:hypothetical protein